ncbi:uncharacterized protein LOC121787261 isoform X1 [Salvia splendens]|uniref:uncharacterized protein LOC121787261 isoform X1 n=1 Tax=Salvia splendens TaxID=180675 RepID=UPI001C26A04E|nr:uncharacterized protein LOC121787261 isoform X1 [Salvia splendens]
MGERGVELNAIEMNGGLRTDSKSGQHPAGDDARMEGEANESFSDTRMMPCVAAEFMDGESESVFYDVQVTEGVIDETELACSVDVLSNNSELVYESHAKNGAQTRSCSEIQLRESVNYAAFGPSAGVRANDDLSSAELEPSVEYHNSEILKEHCTKDVAKEEQNAGDTDTRGALNDIGMDPCAVNHAMEQLYDGKVELYSNSNEVKEEQNNPGLGMYHSDRVKEPTNDDLHSEVSDPNPSPKQVTSSLTISSQPHDVLGGEHGGCGEITSACSWNSFTDGKFCEEEHSKGKLESVSTARVVLEIPKHVRPTGIRKITFKFSKRKDECDTDLSSKPLADDKFDEDLYDNQISVSTADGLSMHGFRNGDMIALENSKVKSCMVDGECLHPRSPSCAPNMELMMSKKIIPDSYPSNVKKLLCTGILEGARVKYISMSGEKELPGIIKSGGFLCGCCVCNFSKHVVSAYEFELHSGSKTSHPNNHIYLENGKPIYSIIEELKTVPLSAVDTVIRAVAGPSLNEEYYQLWKASLIRGHDVACGDSAHLYFGMSQSTSSARPSTEDFTYPDAYLYSRSTPFNQQGYVEALVEQKRPVKKPRHSGSFWGHKKTTEGGNKKRDNDLHKLLFLPNGLPDGTSLAYYSKGKRILGGYKQGNGIVCGCCNIEISPSQFEAHAGWAAKRQPYRNIYTSSGLTLHDIALMLASGQSLPSSGSDDMCAVCGDGGELILCNGCPRAFHADCLGLQCPPENDWYCPHCKDRLGSGRKATGESRPIILRLKRVVKAPEFEPGGCVICRSQDFSAAKFDDRTVIICDQCEREYHVGCLRESEMCDLKELPEDKWFCCDDCHKIFEALRSLASGEPKLVPGAVSSALYKKHATIGLNGMYMNEIQWCILSGKSRAPGHLMLLSRAAAIFRECFDPIVAKSGRDLIPVMVYGRNISGQEFSGMYCVVLIVNSIVVSAALLRIFGKDVAELPLVATDRENQGKGYFQALFSCIEIFLSSMNVKHLVLPAAEEAEPMWLNKLGFTKTSHEKMLKYTRDFQLTIFKGTSLLEKEVQP